MRPVPQAILLTFLLALCGLVAWQWWRESALREIAAAKIEEVDRLTAEKVDAETRLKGADEQIIRLNKSLEELRTNSVARQEFEELKTKATELHETLLKQNATLLEQNTAITQQNEAISKANEIVKTLTSERDSLAKKINEVTERYNKLANQASKPPQS